MPTGMAEFEYMEFPTDRGRGARARLDVVLLAAVRTYDIMKHDHSKGLAWGGKAVKQLVPCTRCWTENE
eukprot:SAG22_NODE_112_length_19423_cov_11.462223_10_plen_69_part_00